MSNPPPPPPPPPLGTTLASEHPAAATGYSNVNGTLFGPNGPSYLDVEQGGVGDCWLMASLAEVAARDPADVRQGLSRHARGDWGDISTDDRELNALSLKEGSRLLSVYGAGEHRFWIITEADRSVTTILMPEDY